MVLVTGVILKSDLITSEAPRPTYCLAHIYIYIYIYIYNIYNIYIYDFVYSTWGLGFHSTLCGVAQFGLRGTFVDYIRGTGLMEMFLWTMGSFQVFGNKWDLMCVLVYL